MKAHPIISVVIPTRNRLGFLREAIASVQTQTYREKEIVVVDDGSSDGTSDWLRQNEKGSLSFLTLESRQERSVARNSGLLKASGKLILFLDDDDRLLPGALEKLSKPLLRRSDAVGSIGGRVDFDGGGNRRRTYHPRLGVTVQLWPAVMAGWVAPSGQCLFRRDWFDRGGSWSPEFTPAEDQELLLKLGREGLFCLCGASVLEQRAHPHRSRERPGVEDRLREHFLDQLQGDERGLGQKMNELRLQLTLANELRSLDDFRGSAAIFGRALTRGPRAVRLLLNPPIFSAFSSSLVAMTVGAGNARRLRALRSKLRMRAGRHIATDEQVVSQPHVGTTEQADVE